MLSFGSFARFVKGFNAFQNEAEFKAKVADAMYDLADYFSAQYESQGDDFIVDAQDDSLSLSLKGYQILASRQTPSRQIWVATPISGSLKFDYDNDKQIWVETKNNNMVLHDCLQKEVLEVLKVE